MHVPRCVTYRGSYENAFSGEGPSFKKGLLPNPHPQELQALASSRWSLGRVPFSRFVVTLQVMGVAKVLTEWFVLLRKGGAPERRFDGSASLAKKRVPRR